MPSRIGLPVFAVHSALLVGHANHRALGDEVVRQQRGLHLQTGDVVARRDDDVVGARGEAEAAVLALHEGVARVARLGLDVHAGDVEAGELVAARRPSGPAEEV